MGSGKIFQSSGLSREKFGYWLSTATTTLVMVERFGNHLGYQTFADILMMFTWIANVWQTAS